MPARPVLPYLAWWQLCRIPNVFTAISDIAMGYLVTRSTPEPWPAFLLLILASMSLYTAGMVLNDVWDVEQDTRERPYRPIPSGRVSIDGARRLGWSLLGGGILAALLAGRFQDELAAWPGPSGVIAVLLAIGIVAYDAVLKRGWAGPWGMGACRFLNVLLGMSFSETGLFEGSTWHIALGIGVYIVGVTLFARTEARVSRRIQLTAGVAVMVVAYVILASVPMHSPRASWWWLILGAIMFPIGRRCASAIARPEPARVQSAVKLSILSIILIDAAICLVKVGPAPATAIALLIIPALALGKLVYST